MGQLPFFHNSVKVLLYYLLIVRKLLNGSISPSAAEGGWSSTSKLLVSVCSVCDAFPAYISGHVRPT